MKNNKLCKYVTTIALATTLMISNMVTSFAYSDSCEGVWGTNTDVNWSYNSSGVLTINGTTEGGSAITSSIISAVSRSPLSGSKYATDVSSIYINNISSITGTFSAPVFYKSGTNSITGFTGLKEIILGEGLNSISYGFVVPASVTRVVFPDSLTKIGYLAVVNSVGSSTFGSSLTSKDTCLRYPLKVVIPSSVTSIADLAFGNAEKVKTNLTVVCEAGSEAYNWAIAHECQIELMDASTSCEATLNNDIEWGIVTPEDMIFQYSSEGWIADTFIGVTGTMPDGHTLTVTTDGNFAILGEKKGDLQKVNVTTEDEKTVTNELKQLVTTLSKSDLSDASETMGEEIGYKIAYKCQTESSTLLRQTYNGTVKFIITETFE